MEVSSGVHRQTLGVANWYLIEDGGKLTLVDAETPADWALLQETLGSLGRRLHDIDAVLLTHGHGDHTGFAERARSEASARVLVHQADVDRARGGKAPAAARRCHWVRVGQQCEASWPSCRRSSRGCQRPSCTCISRARWSRR